MAKQKKQKKAGLAKRQIQKKQRKNAQKRKLIAQRRPAQKQMSMSKVKKNLKNLPSLIFESELRDMTFTPEQIQDLEGQYEKEPDLIGALATAEYQNKLQLKLGAMKGRFEQENDANKTMMVNAMLYFMEQELAPAFMNQIVVGLYLESRIKMETPDVEVTLDLLNQKIKEYDKRWEPYLEEKVNEIMQQREGAEAASATEDEADFEPVAVSAFDQVIDDFMAYMDEQTELAESLKERAQDDLEALLNDYCEEKEITEVSALSARKVKNFVEGWFIRNMNPTGDDVEGMLQSLSAFYSFAKGKGLVDAETADSIAVYLAKKDDILEKLEN